MTVQPALAEAAARYAAAGWPVHPLHDTTSGHCSCRHGPDCRQPGKHPRTIHGFHDATTIASMVARWWRLWPHANIGIPTGPTSRLAVVDLDGTTGAATWDALTTELGAVTTATAVTPHGRHHWYRLPYEISVPRSIRGLGDGVDILGNDGYAIAPPSTITVCPKRHQPSERCDSGYAWTSATRHLPPLPAWIPECLEARARHVTRSESDRRAANTCQPRPKTQPRPLASGGRVRNPRRYALAALRGEVQRVAIAPAGKRNDTLNYAAWRLAPHVHDGTLTESEVRHALTNAADACGLTADDGTRAVHTTITSALRTGGRSL